MFGAADGKRAWKNLINAGEGLAFSPKGDQLACADNASSVSVFNAKTGQALWRTPTSDKAWCLAYRPDGPVIASSARPKEDALVGDDAD